MIGQAIKNACDQPLVVMKIPDGSYCTYEVMAGQIPLRYGGQWTATLCANIQSYSPCVRNTRETTKRATSEPSSTTSTTNGPGRATPSCGLPIMSLQEEGK